MSATAAPVKLGNSNKSQFKYSLSGNQPSILTDIYQDEANIAIWQRKLNDQIVESALAVIKTNPTLQVSLTVGPDAVQSALTDALGGLDTVFNLVADISQLVDMYCCLFDLKRAGLRLTALDRAMCPRFHVDKVPCRLVSTYLGQATQWLPHHRVNRSKLGTGNQGKADEQSGLFQQTADIEQLHHGDVALLKGELWQGNEGAGLVHRSPHLEGNERRLLLTLDFIF